MKRKKILLIVSFIILIILLVAVLYFVFIIKNKSINKVDNNEKVYLETPANNFEYYKQESESKEFIQPEIVIDKNAYSIDNIDNNLYYISSDNKEIYKYSLIDNKEEKILELEFYPEKILWSPNRKNIIILSEQEYHLINIGNKEISKLPENYYNIVWSKDSQKIAYQYIDIENKENNLSIADPDGNNWETIIQFPIISDNVENSILIDWSYDKNKIIYSLDSSDLSGGSYFQVDVLSKEYYELHDWRGIFDFKFISDNKILFSTIDETGTPKLWTMDNKWLNREYTGIDNFADKCITESNGTTLYCVVSEDVYSLKADDILIQYNFETKEKKQITGIVEDNPINIGDMFLSPFEDEVYYLNNIDNKIYKLKIE